MSAPARGRGRAAALYLALAAAFTAAYTLRTGWAAYYGGIEGFTRAAPFPFRYRLLSMLLARGLHAATGESLTWAYAELDTLAVWGALLAFRGVLGEFLRPPLATLLAPGLLYAMGWHFVLMNLQHFPFDLPGVCLFVTGWLLLLRGRWPAFLAVFALATLNRETSAVLGLITACVGAGRWPARRLLLLVGAEAAVWVAIKLALYRAFAGADQTLFVDSLEKNRYTLGQILAGDREAPLLVAKFALWCGGLWAVVPFVYRDLPDALRRSLLALVPFLLGLVFVATIREMRVYGEVLCVVSAAVIVGLVRRRERLRPAAPAPA